MSPTDPPPPTSVPDDGIPPELAAMPDLWDDEGAYGGEATVPFDLDGYTGSLRSVMPETRTMTPQLRELERRLRDRLTPAFPLERVRRVPLEFLWRRYREFAMRGRSAVVDPYGRDPVLAGRLDPLLDFLYTRYFRVETSGVHNLPARGPAILVANHSGALPWDGLVLVQAVRREQHRELRPLLEDAIFQVPYLGVLLNRLGAVRASPENAERLLSEGKLVAVFPEGQQGLTKLYKDRHTLKRFGRGGFVKLALRTGVPLIPVAVVAEGPAAGMLPLASKWRLRFDEPIDVAASHGPEAVDDRILIARLADQVRSRVQEMIGELVTDRTR